MKVKFPTKTGLARPTSEGSLVYISISRKKKTQWKLLNYRGKSPNPKSTASDCTVFSTSSTLESTAGNWSLRSHCCGWLFWNVWWFWLFGTELLCTYCCVGFLGWKFVPEFGCITPTPRPPPPPIPGGGCLALEYITKFSTQKFDNNKIPIYKNRSLAKKEKNTESAKIFE